METYRPANSTAQRIRTGIHAGKNNIAELVSGIAMSGKTNFDSQTTAKDTDTSSIRTQDTSTAENVRASTAIVLKGKANR